MRLEATLGDRQRTWQPFAAERAIVVEVDAAPDLAVMATPDHLTQVLDNLIANALDASPDNSTITLSARPGGLTATIHVVDQGPGLTAEQRAGRSIGSGEPTNRGADLGAPGSGSRSLRSSCGPTAAPSSCSMPPNTGSTRDHAPPSARTAPLTTRRGSG